jgi:DNA topoisomerase-6 subunit B
VKTIPKKPKEMKPHPKGVSVDDIITLSKYTKANKVSTFLLNEFDRIGGKAIAEIKANVSFDLNTAPKHLAWDEAEQIVKSFRKINFIAPKTEGLIPIGEERIRKSLESIVKPEFLTIIERKPSVYKGGFPFQVEVAIAFGGEAGRDSGARSEEEGPQRKVEIMRFANRAPLLFDSGGCATTKAVYSIDWKRYGIKDLDNSPLSIFINLISVHIPYTSAGKQAISDEEEILEEIRRALMDTGRRAGNFISAKRREKEKQMKREIFYKYIPEIAAALNKITKKPEGKVKASLEKLVLEKLKLEELEEKAGETAEEKGEKGTKTEKQGKKGKGHEEKAAEEEGQPEEEVAE